MIIHSMRNLLQMKGKTGILSGVIGMMIQKRLMNLLQGLLLIQAAL